MSFKKYRSSNSPTYMEHKEEKIKETIDDEEYVVFCDDEFVKGLEILMDKAKYDLKRSEEFLGNVKDYKELCDMTIRELNICQKSYMKVCTFAYRMSIINTDPEINFASAIGKAVSITTDTTAVTADDTEMMA